MKNESWTQVGFDEAKRLKAETMLDGEDGMKGETKFWRWYNGQHAGSRSFG